jgi:hypothetical protein
VELAICTALPRHQTLRRDLGHDSGAPPVLVVCARLALARQDREAAVALYRQILSSARPLGRTRGSITILQALASLALHDEELVVAVQLLGAAKAIEKSSDYRQPRHDPSVMCVPPRPCARASTRTHLRAHGTKAKRSRPTKPLPLR